MPATGPAVIAPAVVELLEADRSLAAFGIRVSSASEGRAVVTAEVAEHFANGHGIAHGGLIFALADTALAVAATSLVPGTVTSESSIIYLTPAAVGEQLHAEATVRSMAGRHTVVDVTITAQGRVVAEFRGRGISRREGQS